MFHVLKTPADLDAALLASQDQPILLFKHSASCPFSAQAQIEITALKHDYEVYGLVVQYAKKVSNVVAERLGVEHKSPQAIVVSKGEAKGTFWRSEIEEGALAAQLTV